MRRTNGKSVKRTPRQALTVRLEPQAHADLVSLTTAHGWTVQHAVATGLSLVVSVLRGKDARSLLTDVVADAATSRQIRLQEAKIRQLVAETIAAGKRARGEK
jgi:hypothetical protein